MIDKSGIRLAFRQQLANAFELPGGSQYDIDRLAPENVDFDAGTPDLNNIPGSIWFRETFIWGQEPQISYGFLELMGVAQYDVLSPAGGGTEDAEAVAKLIGDGAFRHGTGFINTSAPSGQPVQVSIVRSEVGKGYKFEPNDGAWFALPVRVTFRAYATVSS